MLVRETEPLPIECVARGYLSGSGWKDYEATGEVCGIRLPPGLRESDRLPEPIFTPATKAQSGHDINISEAEAAALVGQRVLDARPRSDAAAVRGGRRPRRVARHHRRRHEVRVRPAARRRAGPADDRLILIDEVLTPDSSRFWPRDGYAPGGPQPSFDKQFVRDYLERIQLEQAAAGAVAARRRRGEDAREVRRGVPPADRPGAASDRRHDQRTARTARRRDGRQGVQFDDAVREFEKRFIVARARAVRRQPDRRPPTRSASTATR